MIWNITLLVCILQTCMFMLMLYIVTYWGVAWLITTGIRIGTDIFAMERLQPQQIAITKNTRCTRSGIFYGVGFWKTFLICWSLLRFDLSVSSGLIWSVLCVSLSFWESNCGTLLPGDPRGSIGYPGYCCWFRIYVSVTTNMSQYFVRVC
jgi:hypothetical protein